MKKQKSHKRQQYTQTLLRVTLLCVMGIAIQVSAQAYNLKLNSTTSLQNDTLSQHSSFSKDIPPIKLTYYGDTIAAHTCAFRYTEDLMLNGWVREIPGCELLQNDMIYLNGQKVDFIKLNGDNLFKEQNHVLLNHIPYHTVDKVLFYHDVSDDNKDYGKKDYVMDIRLKKAYNTHTMGNIQTAGGTNHRWMGRAFSLTWTPTSRITFFTDVNNVSEYRKPGSTRILGDTRPPVGNSKVYSVGADLQYDDKEDIYSEDAKVLFDYNRSSDETRTATTYFLPSSPAYGRGHQKDWSHGFNLLAENSFELKRIGLSADTHFDYSRTSNYKFLCTGQFSESPADFGGTIDVLDSLFLPTPPSNLLDITVNRTLQSADQYFRQWNIKQQFSYHKTLNGDDYIYANVLGKYSDGKVRQNDSYVQDLLQSPAQSEKQIRKKDATDRNYQIETYVTYGFQLPRHWHLTFTNTFKHERSQKDNDLYRLDWLSDNQQEILLPSVIDFERIQDHSNSWTSDLRNNTYEPLLCVNYQKHDSVKERSTSLLVQLPARYNWATEKYCRKQHHVELTDHRWLFCPELRWDYDTRHLRDNYSFTYKMNMRSPNLARKVNYTDTSNPLRVLKGNPKLKPSSSHAFSFYFHSRLGKSDFHELAFKTTAKFYLDLMAQSIDYNSQTGAYTYQPVNVNGNWNSRSYVRYNLKLDKKKRFDLELSTLFDYFRSVDMITSPETGKPCHNRVDQYIPGESVKLRFEQKQFHVELIGQAAWNHIHPQQSTKEHIHSVDFNYGMNLQCQLPGELRLGTSVRMFSRRGYTERSLNTNNLVWNAQLYRSFFGNQLDVGIKAYDILHQISRTRSAANAQGRIETWQLSLPNFVVLHLTWKFQTK